MLSVGYADALISKEITVQFRTKRRTIKRYTQLCSIPFRLLGRCKNYRIQLYLLDFSLIATSFCGIFSFFPSHFCVCVLRASLSFIQSFCYRGISSTLACAAFFSSRIMIQFAWTYNFGGFFGYFWLNIRLKLLNRNPCLNSLSF